MESAEHVPPPDLPHPAKLSSAAPVGALHYASVVGCCGWGEREIGASDRKEVHSTTANARNVWHPSADIAETERDDFALERPDAKTDRRNPPVDRNVDSAPDCHRQAHRAAPLLDSGYWRQDRKNSRRRNAQQKHTPNGWSVARCGRDTGAKGLQQR